MRSRSDFAAGSLGCADVCGRAVLRRRHRRSVRGDGQGRGSGEPFDVEVFFSRMGRPFRKDPRFTPLMMRLGLVDFWDKAGWPDLCAREGATRRLPLAALRESHQNHEKRAFYPRPAWLGTVRTHGVEFEIIRGKVDDEQ